eukprot:4641-Heterococcus_DN1.PRE.1
MGGKLVFVQQRVRCEGFMTDKAAAAHSTATTAASLSIRCATAHCCSGTYVLLSSAFRCPSSVGDVPLTSLCSACLHAAVCCALLVVARECKAVSTTRFSELNDTA